MIRYINVLESPTLIGAVEESPYRAVIISEVTIPDSQRDHIARELCNTGCRYAMTYGLECDAWEMAVDQVGVLRDLFKGDDEPAAPFVMTTSHKGESLESVFWFSKCCASHDGLHINEGDTLLVHVGNATKKDEFLRLFEAA